MAKATVSTEYINQQREMWIEFLDYFGSGDADMFDTDEEVEEEPPKSLLEQETVHSDEKEELLN